MPDLNLHLDRGKQFIDAFWQHGHPEALVNAVREYKTAPSLIDNDDSESNSLAELGLVEALRIQIEYGHVSTARFDSCINLAEHILHKAPKSSVIRFQASVALSKLLIAREYVADSSDAGKFTRAADLLEACTREPGVPRGILIELLSEYANAGYEQWNVVEEDDFLNRCNNIIDRALVIVGGDRLPECLVEPLVRCRSSRGHTKRRIQDVDQCIKILHQSLDSCSSGDPRAFKYWSLLGYSYFCRFSIWRSPEDIDYCFSANNHARRLVPHTHLRCGLVHCNFASALHSRFLSRANLKDLDDAIDVMRDALGRFWLNPISRSFFVNLLGRLLGIAYTQRGKLDLLDEALQIQSDNLSTASPPYQCLYYASLSDIYALRFSLHGRFPDLDRAIDHLRQGLTRCLPHRIEERLLATHGLGDALITRFNDEGDPADIDEAISVLERSLTHVEPSHRPSTQGRIQSLRGWALVSRAVAKRRTTDLFRGLRVQEVALKLLPKEHVHRSLVHFRIGMTLLHMAQYGTDSSNASPLYASIASFHRGLRRLSEVHPRRGTILLRIGEATLALPDAGETGRIDEAIATFRRVALDQHCTVTDRFAGAVRWARTAHNHRDPFTALDGYQCAISLLPQMAWIGLEDDLRMRRLAKQTLGLSSDAAACAVETGQLKLAIELLEQSRSVMWNTSQELRADLGRLREVDPQLAQELGQVGAALQYRPSFQAPDIKDQDHEVERHRQHRLAARWTALIEKTRQLPGFEQFLAPLSYEVLRHAARCGPVIIVNTSTYRCDALIIPSPDHPIQHVPLPTLYNAQVVQSAQFLRYALSLAKDKPGMQYLENAFAAVLRHLWGAAGIPIYTALAQYLDDSTSNNRRVWWCPIGAVAMLPLHACGPLDGSYPDMAELVVSSYTPTLSALVRAFTDSLTKTRSPVFDILVVSQSDAPGHPPLLCAEEERDGLMQLFPSTGTFVDGQQGTIARVQELIANHKWLHICSHGTQRANAPLDSALHLHDGPLTLRHLTQSALPNAEFAFLSACHSARGDAGIPDESLHLAAGLLFAGFRGVVATQWSIADKDAPQVTREFYSSLLGKSGRPLPEDAAEALHRAVNVLRRSGVPPFRWAPFIHVGL